MSEHSQDERDRADRLLAPDFLDRLPSLDDASLLAARDEAVEEEDRISYVRRLLQGRLDLLSFEKERRAGHGTQPELGSAEGDRALAKTLGKVLTAPPTGGLPVIRPGDTPTSAESASVSERRRAAEAAAGDVRLSDPKTLDDDALDAALSRIAAFESEVSVNRRRLQHVADALLAEVSRRVEAGTLSAEEMPAGQHGDAPPTPPR